MEKKWLVAVTLAGALSVPVAALAHAGHLHKVMGTVSSVEGNHVTVKTTDGKIVIITFDTKTSVTRGKTKLDASAVKAGERVVVEGTEARNMIAARTVRLGPAAAAR
jgi:hypothetical protein